MGVFFRELKCLNKKQNRPPFILLKKPVPLLVLLLSLFVESCGKRILLLQENHWWAAESQE